jgi:hypothetical protein
MAILCPAVIQKGDNKTNWKSLDKDFALPAAKAARVR